MTAAILIALLGGLLIGAGATQIVHLTRELDRLRDRFDERKRHDHNTLAGLFDASALSLDSSFEAAQFAERMMSRLRLVSQILGEASTPYAYDKAQPSRRDQADDQARQAILVQLQKLVEELQNGKASK